MKMDIENHEDIKLMVITSYDKSLADKGLGSI